MNYLLVPLITIGIALAGSAFTQMGLRRWYQTLKLPTFTPKSPTIGIVWTAIFTLGAISALLFWNSSNILHDDPLFLISVGAFVINGILNVFWSYLFFYQHMLGYSVIECGALALSVLSLIFFTYPVSVWSAILLLPYFAWVCFATFLTYTIWNLNKNKKLEADSPRA